MINDLPLRLLTQDSESGQASGSNYTGMQKSNTLYISFNTVRKDNSNISIYFCIFNSNLKKMIDNSKSG